MCLIFVTLTGEDENFFGLDLNYRQNKNDGAYAIYPLVIIDPRPRREGRSLVIIIISPSIVNIIYSCILNFYYTPCKISNIPISSKLYVWVEGVSVCCPYPSDRHVLKMDVTLTWDLMFCIIVDIDGLRTVR